jgi:hypothetical protein
VVDLSKLAFFTSWQNGVSFLAATAVALWLSPLPAAHFAFVMIIMFAAARLVIIVVEAAIKALRKF